MSQGNVEVVVSALQKWNSGDDTGTLEFLAADVEVQHNIVRVGHEGLEGDPGIEHLDARRHVAPSRHRQRFLTRKVLSTRLERLRDGSVATASNR